jgi:hypothetical protein
MPEFTEYPHTPLERLDNLGRLVRVCAGCSDPYPCHVQQAHARYAALELARYMARYFPPVAASSYGHAADLVAAEVSAA